ncbi:MAG: hypothetical protein KKF57_14625 [Firmicutes bacterium]|nr:hypothetical protein [Bacillota bacterium]
MNYHEVLKRSVEFASTELDEFKKTKDLSDTTNMVVSSLFRKIIELSTGVMISASNGLAGPAQLNYRGLIEAYLAFKYIIQVPEETNSRAIAYKISYHKEQIKSLEDLKKNELLDINPTYIEGAGKYHQDELQRPDFQEVLTEHDKLHRQDNRGHIPKWYSLYGGPKTINQLVKKLENDASDQEKGLISTIYGALSADAHSLLTLRDIYMNSNGVICLKSVHQNFDPNSDRYNLLPVRATLTSSIKSFTTQFFPEFEEEFIEFVSKIRGNLIKG